MRQKQCVAAQSLGGDPCTCPACGKENTEEVKQCTTCYEELAAADEATAHSEAGGNSKPAESEAEAEASAEETPAAVEQVASAEALDEPATAGPAAKKEEPEEASEPVKVEAPPPIEEVKRAASPTTVIKESSLPLSSDGKNETFTVGSVKLVVEQGLSINKEYLLNDPELIVGRRDPEQEFIPDIDLFDQENANNRYISRRQARLFYKEGGLFVEDLESSNGTVVNNKPIKPNIEVELHPGDKLLFGQSVMFRVRNLV